jgi:thymidylate kinase
LLQKGHIVISDRNIHSSLIYQGVVGKLGRGSGRQNERRRHDPRPRPLDRL